MQQPAPQTCAACCVRLVQPASCWHRVRLQPCKCCSTCAGTGHCIAQDFDQRTHSLRKLAVCNLAHAMGHSILFLLQKDRRLSDHDVRKQQLLLSNTSELAPHTPTAPDLLTSAMQKEPNSCASVASVLQPSDCTAFQGC